MRNRDKHIAPRIPKMLVKASAVMLLLLSLGGSRLHAQGVTKENKIKAVFLYNFTQFVEWPASSFASPSSPFVIGILGEDPFGAYLDETIRDEKVNGHPIVVQRFHDVKDANSCQILFISYSDPERTRENLLAVNSRILTVGDRESFVRSGGMIRFFTENNKIRLQINPEAARSSELNISSKLLRVSDIYDPRSQPR